MYYTIQWGKAYIQLHTLTLVLSHQGRGILMRLLRYARNDILFVTLSDSEGSKRGYQLYGQSAGKDINSYHSLSAKPGIADANYASYRHN